MLVGLGSWTRKPVFLRKPHVSGLVALRIHVDKRWLRHNDTRLWQGL